MIEGVGEGKDNKCITNMNTPQACLTNGEQLGEGRLSLKCENTVLVNHLKKAMLIYKIMVNGLNPEVSIICLA